MRIWLCGPYEAQWERHEIKTRLTICRPNAWSAGGIKGVHKAGCQLRVLANSSGANIPRTHDLHNSLFFIRYCFRRLPFGITSAHEHFQKRMHKVLEDLPGVLCMMDDIIIFGDSSEEHDATVKAVFRCLEDNGVTINFEKSLVC